jgi:transposase
LSSSARRFLTNINEKGEPMVRSIGMDVHRSFAQIAIVDQGVCRDAGRIGVRPQDLREWASTLRHDDQVVLEATTNSDAIATMLRHVVARVVVSNPRKTRAIAEAKVKTDKVDARILAQLLAADFLPETWVADDQTRTRRRLVWRRTQLVKQRTRLKNQVHGILARNLVPTCPHADLFSGVGRTWLRGQQLPADEWRSVESLIRQLDFHGAEIAAVDRDIAIDAIDDAVIARLMSIPGVDVAVAMSVVAAVGDFRRFETPDKLVAYLGLNPRVYQSGNGPAFHGSITKTGRAQARGMLVEAAFAASRAPGPLRAFYRRVKQRRGWQIATVATARKLTVLCWHLVVRNEDYAFARPTLTAHKRRSLELAAGAASRRGPTAGPSHDYHIKQLRDAERALVEQHERAYELFVAHWEPKRPVRA